MKHRCASVRASGIFPKISRVKTISIYRRNKPIFLFLISQSAILFLKRISTDTRKPDININ